MAAKKRTRRQPTATAGRATGGKASRNRKRRAPERSQAPLIAIGVVFFLTLVAVVVMLFWERTPPRPEVSPATRAMLVALNQKLEAGELDEGIAMAEEHLRTMPEAPGVHYMLGLFRQARGDDEAAVKSFEIETEKSPGHADNRFQLAASLSRLGRGEEARDQLLRARKLAPENADIALALGRSLAQADELEAATEHLEAARKGKPAEAAFELGLIARKRDDNAAAEAWFRKALEADPDHLGAVFNLGQTLILAGRTEDGERFLVRHAELQKEQDRLEVLTKAASQDWSDSTSLVNLGRYQLVLGDAVAAARSFAAALGRDPKDTAAMLGMVRSQIERNDLAAALEQVEAALALDSESAEAHFLHGLVLHSSGEFERARVALNRSRELEPWGADEFLFLGNTFAKTGALRDAELAYEQALKLDAEMPDPYYKLALVAYERDELEAARDRLERYVELEPNNPLARILAGIVSYRLGDTEEATSSFHRALNRLAVTVTREEEIDRTIAGFVPLSDSAEALALLRRLRDTAASRTPSAQDE